MPLLDISIDRDQVRAIERLGEQINRDQRPLLEEVADQLAQLLRSHIEEGAFAPPSPVTLEIRRRRGRTGQAPLVDTGRMLGRIRSRASKEEAKASAPWPALPIQLGVTTSKDSAIPGVNLPPRPFVYVTDAETEELLDRIEEFYFGDAEP